MIYHLANIPAPPFDSIGFVKIYGITMALGMGVAVIIAHKIYTRKNPGSTLMIDMFLPTVLAGIIGARVYHLFTGYDWDANGFGGVANIRAGGLSIWGAVIAGGLAVYVQCRIKKVSFLEVGDAVVPGLLVAQAIGRIGNYFNQELFGRELNAFWALKVDPLFRPIGLENVETYHPTFLYEMIWTLSLAVVIIFFQNHYKGYVIGQSIAIYIAGYCFGRAILETVRIDAASELFGIRFNLLLSVVLCLVGIVMFFSLKRSGQKVQSEVKSQ